MAIRKKISKKTSIKKWIRGDRKTLNITSYPIYSLNQRGGVMLT